MSTRTKWLSVLLAGWILGWYTHQHWYAQDIPPANKADFDRADSARLSSTGSWFQQQRPIGPDDPWATEAEGFEHMLIRGEYHQAIQRFNAASAPESREAYRATLTGYLNTLIAEQDYLHADELLSAYLAQEYRDVDMLLLRATLSRLQGRHRQAIEALYDARSYEYRPEKIELITNRIRTYVAEYDRQLRAADEQQARLALYEYLVQVEPDHSPFFIALARTQLSQSRLDEARQSLFLVQSDPLVSDEARQLLSQIENNVTFPQASRIAIPLVRQGEHFLIDAWVNDRIRARLLIDTGASMTVLRTDVLRAAVKFETARPSLQLFSTANGLVEAAVFRLASLSIGGQNVANIEVAGLDLPGLRSADGLLGMNFLKNFKFFIDQNKAELRLSHRTESR